MGKHEPRGVVHWIDHFIVGTNDMVTWVDWAVNATGITRRPIRGITTNARKKDVPIMCFLWWDGESCRIGAFLQPEVYPAAKPLGEELPRCGFYIRPEDVDRHVKRLERHGIPHTDPVRTVDGGDEGTVIYFADPDGNQFEFWAPDHMPEGAMEICTSEGVGRISHAVYGSRDLGKTADFFKTYCALTPEVSPNVAEGNLVLRLQAGGRLIYKLTDQVDERVAGHGPWWDMHTALTVRAEEFMPNYRRMWETLPEEAMAKEEDTLTLEQEDSLPARTGLHRSPVGYRWKAMFERGDEFYDWDGHAFHFFGGKPVKDDGSLALYTIVEQEEYLTDVAVEAEKARAAQG